MTAWVISATLISRPTRIRCGRSPFRTDRCQADASQPGDDHRQDIRSAFAAALYLRKEFGGEAARSRPFSQALSGPRSSEFAAEGGYAPPTEEDKAANQATLAKLCLWERARQRTRPRRRSKDPGLGFCFRKPRRTTGRAERGRAVAGPFPRRLAFWEGVVTAGLVLCTADHHVHDGRDRAGAGGTEPGVFPVAGCVGEAGSSSAPRFGRTRTRLNSGSFPCCGGRSWWRRARRYRAADRTFECDLLERIRTAARAQTFSSRRSSCWRAFPRSCMGIWPCCW